MKNNNKGFFLAETIVMIALVTTVMAFVYPNVTKLYDNYVNRTKYYDQTEDLYTLKAISELLGDKINISTQATDDKGVINVAGCKKFDDNGEINLDSTSTDSRYFVELTNSLPSNVKNLLKPEITKMKIYLTGYMTNLSSKDYNFNKYLKRLKKTTNDRAAYRLIVVFEINGGLKRYASIKIENPNAARDCNL